MKVLVLRSSFNPGGAEVLLLNLFNFPQHKITFFYILMKESDLISQLDSNTNKHYEYLRKKAIDLRVIVKTYKLIKKENIQNIHTHQLIELIYALIIKAFIPRINVYHSIHGVFNLNWYIMLEKILIKLTKKTFTVSESTKKTLVKMGYPEKKIHILYNAVNTPSELSEEDKILFYKKIEFIENNFIIGMVGNFVPEKDQLTLIKAFNLISNTHPNAKLIFIGKESQQEIKCKEFVFNNHIKNIYFLGSIQNANKYLQLFNVFVLSSKSETFSIALFEAILAKVPVIASDLPVFQELSANGRYFTLFRTGDEEDLAGLLDRYLIDILDSKFIDKLDLTYNYARSNFGDDLYIDKLFHYYSN